MVLIPGCGLTHNAFYDSITLKTVGMKSTITTNFKDFDFYLQEVMHKLKIHRSVHQKYSSLLQSLPAAEA